MCIARVLDLQGSWLLLLLLLFYGRPCRLALQVERLLHFSDLGAAADHASARMRSKAAGDAAVRETFPDATIFK
jgi:hypothetical protein